MPEKSNPLKSFFKKELHIKFISLLIAIVSWFGVMNAIAPLETKDFSIPIKVENVKSLASQGYIVSNMDEIMSEIIDIDFEATRNSLDELTKGYERNDLFSVIDLSGISVDDSESFPQEFNINVQPRIPTYLNSSSYNIKSYTPSYLTIKVDKLVSADYNVEIKSNNSSDNNFEVLDIKADVETVTIGSTQEKIDSINSVVLNVDCSSITEHTVLNIEPTVYDKNNNEIKNLIIEPSHIKVDISVGKKSEIEINKPLTTGTLPGFLKLKSMDWSPKEIEIVGADDVVEGIKSIDIDPIDLSQIRRDTTVTRDISDIIHKLGVRLKDEQNSKISVTLKFDLVNPIDVSIDKSSIKVTGLPDSKTIVLPDKVDVKIAGVTSVDASALSPSVDVTGLSDGTHSVKLNLTLPANAAINDNVYINVDIISKEQPSVATTASPVQNEAAAEPSSEEETSADNADFDNEEE